MDAIIYGITGHREIVLPLDEMEIDELDIGEEFVFKGQIYEIRSLSEIERGLLMNVVQIM